MKFQSFFYRILSRLPFEPKRRVYRLEVEAKDIELLSIKDFVQRICDSAGCRPRETFNIKLAIDEACSNIIRHAYKDKEGGKITLEMGVGFTDLMIKIIDYGKPFNFNNIKDPDLNQYIDIGKKGGLGIWLVKKLMTDVRYKAFSDHNELILYRRLSKTRSRESGVKRGSYSVSVKFTLGSTFIVLVLITLAYFYLSQRQQNFVLRQQRDNITTILQTMSAEAGDLMARKSDLELDQLIREVMGSDKNKVLSYGFVTSAEGRYLAHSDLNQLFKTYVPPGGVQTTRSPGIQIFRVKNPEGALTDYASAIYYHGQWMGEVHVGETDAAVQQVASRVKADLQRLMILIFLVSVVGLYFFSRIFIKPFQKILEGVRAMGAGDFNAKIDVESQDEFGQLANIFNDMTSKIQDSQKGMMENERMQQEMQVAQEIQHTLLPREFPQIEGYEIGATYRAAKEVGGDYYDFFWVDPTTLGIVVADVSGKGVPGSLVMTMIRTAMRLEARGNRSSSSVLGKVNQHVTADMKRGMFVTMFYIILDSRNRSINFSSAGHNPMILYREKTKEVYFLKPKGFPVGIDLPEEDMFEKSMALQKVSLEKNDMLVIYTDGITEAMNPESDQFGEDRLTKVIKENAHLTPAEFVEKLNEAVAQFTRGAEQNDDITVVAIKEKMKAENVEFKFRKKLIDLVEKKGLSVVEACRQMNTSSATYYRLKKMFVEKGKDGLKPIKNTKRGNIKELTFSEQQAVMAMVRKNPQYGPRLIVEAVEKSSDPPIKLNQKLVSEFLKRKGLSDVKAREARGTNEVDGV
jgi:serine phosphatase RsbU (regulator of sigma subunit)/anti-sigma regulatory factor (Ser/Thr protein kinase)/transposase